MAVTAVRLKSVDSDFDENGFRNHNAIFEVETDDANDLSITARDAAGVPNQNDTFAFGNDSDPDATMRRKRASLHSVDESYKLWTVSCFYTNNWQIGNGWPQGGTVSTWDSPLDMPAKWSGGSVQFTRDFQKDRDGKAIKNAAGDPFVDPSVSGDDSRFSIVCEKNFPSADLIALAEYVNAINSTTFWGFTAKRVKVQSVTFDQRYFLNSSYISGRVEVNVTPVGITWDRDLLEAGYYQLVGGVRERITDKHGAPVSTPWPISELGAALTDAQIASGTEAYTADKIYPEKDLNGLGFPSVLGAPF